MDRARQIADLFGLLIEFKPEQRLHELERRCADPELRREVIRLLEADVADRTGVTTRLHRDSAQALEDEPEDEAIGPYRVVRRLGEGGLGYVVLAFREAEGIHKRVAIKLIKKGMDTEEILRRFNQERQVLASLNHPNIARVFDAGTTADGRPYFVMEYIEGIPIDQFCDDRSLSTPDRVKLFIKVCAAVHYAHQNLVIHRDIKPANILITSDGEPHLLDFGIAKLLNPDMLRSPVTTGPQLRLMTPEYASPEQVEGKPVTTASDVYSLGVLFYHLLTGRAPYTLRSRIYDDIARIITTTEPLRPSSVIIRALEYETEDGIIHKVPPEHIARTRDGNPRRLRKRLSGDLDNIVLMALRKSPARRYASAEQLARDCQRHLDGRAISAHPPSRWYTISVFIRRNPSATAGAAAAIIAIATLGVVSTVQAIHLNRKSQVLQDALTLAQEESQVRKEAAALAAGLIRDIAHTASVRPIIYSDKLALQVEGWLNKSEVSSRPELSLQLHGVAADMLAATRKDERALPHAQEALLLGERVYGKGSPELARLHSRMSRLRTRLLQHDEAISHAERAVALTGSSNDIIETLNARWRLALALHAAEHISESRKLAEEILAATSKTRSAVVRANARLYASEHASLANEHELAERLIRDALGVLQDAYLDGRPIAMVVRTQIGRVLLRAGKVDDAEGELDVAVTECMQSVATVHRITFEAKSRHAEALHLLGRFDEAAARLADILPFQVQSDKPRHSRTAWLQLRRSAALFAGGHEDRGREALAWAVSRGIMGDPNDQGWAADIRHAETVLRVGNWKLDDTLPDRLGHLSWLVATQSTMPEDLDDIDSEPPA